MQVIHMESINTYESDLNIRIKEALHDDGNFIQIRNNLKQE
jgi:hypothetical protein